MAKSQKFTKKQVEEALRQAGGMKYIAAEKLKCAPSTITAYLKKYKSLEKVVDEATELTLDVAEAALINKIKDGDTTSIIFYLKTKGKKRGYSERHEITGSDGEAVKYVIEVPKEARDDEEWQEMYSTKPQEEQK